MSAAATAWTVRLTDTAAEDFKSIIRWSVEQFGEQQARVYSETLSATVEALMSGPKQVGVRWRDDIAKGLLTIHVARRGRKGSHFVMLRVVDREGQIIDVLRFLHQVMDAQRHLPASVEGDDV